MKTDRIYLADAEQQNAKAQGRKEIPFDSRAWAAFGRIPGRAAGESAILLSSRCPRFLRRLAQGCASAKRCAHACCSVSILAPLRLCVLLLHPFDLAKQLQRIGSVCSALALPAYTGSGDEAGNSECRRGGQSPDQRRLQRAAQRAGSGEMSLHVAEHCQRQNGQNHR